MSEEIIVKNGSRAVLITLSIMGLIISLAVAVFFPLMGFDGNYAVKGLLAWIGSFVGIAYCGWSIFSLSSGKHYLESSSDGLMIGGSVRCYVPWNNFHDIRVEKKETEGDRVFLQKTPSIINKILIFELINPDEIFFDSPLHRLVNRHSLHRKTIQLATKPVTSLPVESICESLNHRWKRALGDTNKATDDSNAVIGHDGI